MTSYYNYYKCVAKLKQLVIFYFQNENCMSNTIFWTIQFSTKYCSTDCMNTVKNVCSKLKNKHGGTIILQI